MKGNKKNKPNTPGGFSLAWNINLFRFWLALGSPKLAKRYFDRIPLPNEDLAEKDFFLYERSIWSPYLAPDGSLRPIAWGKMLLSVLVFGAGISLLTIFLTAYTNQSATIRTQAAVIKDQETQLASKTRTHNSSKPPQDKSAASTEQVIPTPADTSIPADTSTPPGTSTPQETLQSPPEGCWQVMMTNGKSALLDTRKTPGFPRSNCISLSWMPKIIPTIFIPNPNLKTAPSLSIRTGRQWNLLPPTKRSFTIPIPPKRPRRANGWKKTNLTNGASPPRLNHPKSPRLS